MIIVSVILFLHNLTMSGEQKSIIVPTDDECDITNKTETNDEEEQDDFDGMFPTCEEGDNDDEATRFEVPSNLSSHRVQSRQPEKGRIQSSGPSVTPPLPPTPRFPNFTTSISNKRDALKTLANLSKSAFIENGGPSKTVVFDYGNEACQTHVIESYQTTQASDDTSVMRNYYNGCSEFSKVGEKFSGQIESDTFSKTVCQLLEHSNMVTIPPPPIVYTFFSNLYVYFFLQQSEEQKQMMRESVKTLFLTNVSGIEVFLKSYKPELDSTEHAMDAYDKTLERMEKRFKEGESENGLSKKDQQKLMERTRDIIAKFKNLTQSHKEEKSARLIQGMKMGYMEQVMKFFLEQLGTIQNAETNRRTAAKYEKEVADAERSKHKRSQEAAGSGCVMQ